MTVSSLPITRIVNVAVQLTPTGAQAQSLKDLLLLNSQGAVIDPVERMRTYSSLAQVGQDFATNNSTYIAAQAWFSQKPQPTRLYIGLWARSAVAGGLRGAPLISSHGKVATYNAITNGSFLYSVDGGAAVHITGLNFSAAATLQAVAAIIDTAIATADCAYNASYNRFEFISHTQGVLSTVSALSPEGTGTDISNTLLCDTASVTANGGGYLYTGIAAESEATVALLFDTLFGQKWYAFASTSPLLNDANQLSFAGVAEGMTNKHIYAGMTYDTTSLLTTDTTSLVYLLSQLGYDRTIMQFSTTSGTFGIISALAKLLSVDYNGSSTAMTLKFKTEPGILDEVLNETQVDALESKNCNIQVSYNDNSAILEQGTMESGVFADVVTGCDWLAVELQVQGYNVLLTSPTKIPQTDAGMHLFVTTFEKVLDKGVSNGLIAPGVWNSNGFGTLKDGDFMPKGYYVYAPPVASQPENERALRQSVLFQIAVKLAGAVHSLQVSVLVNQ